jgi:hypothetical protein
MLSRLILLPLLGLFIFYSGCALIDPYSYRDDPNFVDGKYEGNRSEDSRRYQENVCNKH